MRVLRSVLLTSASSLFSAVPPITRLRILTNATSHEDLVQSPPGPRPPSVSPKIGVLLAMPGRYQVLAGILAQEISRGESLLFLRKAPKLRQRAQPLCALRDDAGTRTY